MSWPAPVIEERLQPQSLEAEQAALGAALTDAAAADAVFTLCHPDDFYVPAHRRIAAVIEYLHGKDEPVDVFSVPAELERRGQLEGVGGKAAITNLALSVPTTAHAEYYARTVQEKAALRRVLTASGDLQAMCYDGASLDEVAQFAGRLADKATERRGVGEPTPARELAQRAHQSIFEGAGFGITTGLRALDHLTDGWHPTHLTIIAGRPKMGKTDLFLHFARTAARAGLPCLLFSLEMSEVELAKRHIAALAQVNSRKLRKPGALQESEPEKVGRAIGRLGELDLEVDDRPNLSLVEVKAVARRWRRKHPGPALLLLDYLQLMAWPDQAQNENNAHEQNANGLKALAKELELHVIALSQLNRDPAKNAGNHRPSAHHLRGSGGIEQAADQVLFIHRAAYYEQQDAQEKHVLPVMEETWPQAAEIIVGLGRHASSGTAFVSYDARYAYFEDLQEGTPSDQDAPPEDGDLDWRCR